MEANTILVAEDCDDDVFLLKRALTRAGIPAGVQVAPDGEEALAYLRAEGRYSDRQKFPFPTLVLLDIKMPRMNGFEVLDQIRRDRALRRLTVILFTSSHEERDVNLAADLCANSYVLKSHNLELLMQLMQTMQAYWLSLHQPGDCHQP
jgi:CheY-like chemotaxis protein